MFEIKVRQFFDKYDLLNPANRIMVAVSGGVDSLSLLNYLFFLREELQFNLFAVHVNHQWRDKESDDDERFVYNFCKEKNIELFIEKLDKNIPQTELSARNKRYEVFNKYCLKINTNILLTAHNQSDQVETILYRIIKGTGIKGLCGIPEVRYQENASTIYRPLINCLRSEIEQYATNNNLQFRLDSSNYDTKYLRNKVRHHLLPELMEYNSSIDEALVRLAKISKYYEDTKNYIIENIYKEIFIDKETLKTNEFKILPSSLKPIILVQWLEKNDIEPEYLLIERLLSYIETVQLTPAGKKFSLVKNLFVHITQKFIKIVSVQRDDVIQSKSKLAIPGVTELKELNVTLKVTQYSKSDNENIKYPPSSSNKAIVDLSSITEELYLRTRLPGDIINPLGMTGHMKLKEYFINKYIPQEQRNFIPVIATAKEILWIPGMVISNKIKVVNKPTHIFEIVRD